MSGWLAIDSHNKFLMVHRQTFSSLRWNISNAWQHVGILPIDIKEVTLYIIDEPGKSFIECYRLKEERGVEQLPPNAQSLQNKYLP